MGVVDQEHAKAALPLGKICCIEDWVASRDNVYR
jgi:hypothetical protein